MEKTGNDDATANNTEVTTNDSVIDEQRGFVKSLRELLQRRMLIVIIVAGVCLSLAGVVLWMIGGRTDAGQGAAIIPTSPLRGDIVYLKNFAIDYMDIGETPRIIVCDVALALSRVRDVSDIENNPDVRAVIYRVTKKNGAILMTSPEGRRNMKTEMKELLNRVLGGDVIRTVYLTRLVVL